MTILEEIGVDFLHERARELFQKAGMKVEENRVRFERDFVLEQVARTPAMFDLQARNKARSVVLGGDNVVTAPVYGPPFVTDLERGRRGATIEDFTNFDKLAQAVEQIHCAGGTTVEPEDLPLGTRHLDMVYSHVRWTDKPFMGSVISSENARDTIEMAAIVCGGRESIEKTPAVISLINVNSPLRYDDRMLGALLEYSEAGQPVIVTPFLMAGAMSPMGLAGTVAQQTAEALAGIALVQLIRPGTPSVYGSFLTNTGMPVDDEGLAMDALREVGPGGHFLGAEHTMRHYRTGFYRPWVSSTENFDRWQRFGSRTADVVAAERWKQLLAEYPDPGIDPGV